jgi:hypothetical protein
MNRISLGALALPLLAGGAAANKSGAEDWVKLDREIESLSKTLASQDPPAGLQVSGWIRTQYDSDSDNDLGGFGFEGIRINFAGKIGDVELKISIDGDSPSVSLKDAFARFPVAENIKVQMGQFKSRFVFSSFASDERLVLYRRTQIGDAWATRDPGIQVDGTFGPFIAILQAQNGGDAAGDELALTAKGILTLFGGKPIEKQSGGYGPDAPTALTLGLGWFDDGSADDSSAIAAEAMFVTGPFFAHAELVDHDEGFAGITTGPAKNAVGFADATPFSATAAFMLNSEWELAASFQDDDDVSETTRVVGGVTYYVNGHATKWQLNYSTADSDDPAEEIDLITLGLTVIV